MWSNSIILILHKRKITILGVNRVHSMLSYLYLYSSSELLLILAMSSTLLDIGNQKTWWLPSWSLDLWGYGYMHTDDCTYGYNRRMHKLICLHKPPCFSAVRVEELKLYEKYGMWSWKQILVGKLWKGSENVLTMEWLEEALRPFLVLILTMSRLWVQLWDKKARKNPHMN